MIRFKKGMAALLSVAMIATSFQMPVYAEEFTDDSVSVETAEVTETGATEEPEVELGENLDTVFVYNASDLVSALNGKGVYEGDAERIKRGNYKIKLSEYADGKSYPEQWILSGNDVKNIQLNKEISEIDFSNQEITFDSSIKQSETDYFKLVIPKEAKITLKNAYGFPWMIENQGDLVLEDDNLSAVSVNAVKNNGFLEIKGNTNISGYDLKGKNVITNTGSMIVYSGNIFNSGDSAGKENAVIYSNGGSVSINGGEIYNTTTSGNAIYLSGSNAVATVRGVTNIHSDKASAVVNRDGAKFIMNRAVEDGNNQIDIFNDSSTYPTVYTYNGATTEMYSGTIRNNNYNGAAVRMTPMSGNSGTDGTVIMSDGEIGDYCKYGIIYKENKPVLKYGTVYGNTAAVMKVSANMIDAGEETTYQFVNRDGVIVNAFEKDGNGYKALRRIECGLYGLDGDSNNKDLDSISVNSSDELKTAISSTTVNRVYLVDDITISDNLVFSKEFTIKFNGHRLLAPDMKGTITIKEGKRVNFVNDNINNPTIIFDSISSNRAALLNSGELYLENIIISGAGTQDGYTLVQNEEKGSIIQSNEGSITAKSSGKSKERLTYCLKNFGTVNAVGEITNQTYGDYAVSIYNKGKYRQAGEEDGGLYTGNINANGSYSTALWNLGTFDIENSNVCQSNEKDNNLSSNAAVYIEGGTVRLQSGNISTDSKASSSHAIVYTDDKCLPILIGGTVTGAAANGAVSKNEPARGSAVVCFKDGKIKTGSFVNGNGDTVNGQDAIYIQDGKIKTDADATSGISYLLMENGETITNMVAAMETNGTIQQNYLTYNDYTLSSNNPSVVKVSENKLAITAMGKGYAKLTFQWKGSGITDSVRIEVVDKGKRKTISANDYEGSLINKVEYVNAYKKSQDIAMEWHLTSSEETSTGVASEITKDMKIQPDHVIIEDKTFEKYFEIVEVIDDENYDVNNKISYDKKDKKYYFTIKPKDYVKLIQDEVSSINNIEVKIQVTNGSKVTSVKTIGSFNIVMQNKKPTMTFKPITLNSAYQAFLSVNQGSIEEYLLNASSSITFHHCNASEGIYVSNDGYFNYIGDGSIKKGNIHAKANITGYNGTYETDIPVKIEKSYPVVTLAEKSITIAEDVAEMTDIKVDFNSKNMFSLNTMNAKVEITDKNSKFMVSEVYIDQGIYAEKGIYKGKYVYLQPKQNITKAQTVNLKVTYDGTVAVKGKEYSTNLKIKINPVNKKNFTMKLTTKNPTLLTKVSVNNAGYQQYGESEIEFTTTPTNYKGGYFTVSNLDGSEVKGVSINNVTSDSPGKYSFTVFANKEIVNKKGKLEFYVTRYGNSEKKNDGTKAELGKKMKVTINLIKDSSLKFTKNEVTMDVSTIEGVSLTYTLEKMSTSIPIKTVGVGNWDFTAKGSALFVVNKKKSNAKNVIIQPVKKAIQNGAIVPGGSYQLILKGENEIGEVVYQDITVKVKKGKVTNSICDTNLSEKKNFTLYKAAPAMQQTFTVITQNPYYGMFVKNVELTDKNSPFELDHAYQKSVITYDEYVEDCLNNNYYYSYKDYQSRVNGQFRLCFKNGKVNKKIKKSCSVKIRITYENGQTVDKTIKVTVK